MFEELRGHLVFGVEWRERFREVGCGRVGGETVRWSTIRPEMAVSVEERGWGKLAFAAHGIHFG